jgi:hypothetical protein
MTALATLVEPLKRELAVPGTFDTIFPDTDDTALEGSLADGFGEAQLRGFFPTFELTEDDGAYETTEDLTAAGAALVLIFTSMRIIRAQLRALTSSETYKADRHGLRPVRAPRAADRRHRAAVTHDEVPALRLG